MNEYPKYIYAIYDPLHEEVLCTHVMANIRCETCKRDIFNRDSLIEVRHTVEIDKDVTENWDSLDYRMEEEGFNYCFDSYSDWEEIKEPEFHRLRKNYLEAAAVLKRYVKTKHNTNKESKIYGKRL